jgi:hypothetical protein
MPENAAAEHLAPPHLHDTEHVCRAWHLTARTPHGRVVTITTRSHPDDLTLPPGWELIR